MTGRHDRLGGMREEQAPIGGVVFDEDMYDVTNISTRRTGIGGVIYASTTQGQHGETSHSGVGMRGPRPAARLTRLG